MNGDGQLEVMQRLGDRMSGGGRARTGLNPVVQRAL